ncbi:hypothetical protein Asi02nite_71460 [Asanoa siamensis]|uniref:Uncharacterized protein n=1 Tax=Asanoa siamensis TaxID=926357 RepID=A0ABQ4D278_9ACTN|nr:hypothetical protein Asi02nite_71460 [Asanoa siamensis]
MGDTALTRRAASRVTPDPGIDAATRSARRRPRCRAVGRPPASFRPGRTLSMTTKRKHEKQNDEEREAARRALQTSMDTRQ